MNLVVNEIEVFSLVNDIKPGESLAAFFKITKPKQALLLLFTAFSTYILTFNLKKARVPVEGMTVFFPLLLALMGVDTLNNYLDRDIDAVMERTRNRPLPKGELKPLTALLYGSALILSGLIFSAAINPKLFIVILIGSLIDLFAYTKFLKRRSPLNIIIGSFAGGVLPIYGWLAAYESLTLTPFLISCLIIFWTPSHIWSLALFYKEDYRKVNVPMLPVVKSDNFTIKAIASTNILTFLDSLIIGVEAHLTIIYFLVIIASSLFYLSLNLYGLFNPSLKIAKYMFKASSPFLAVVLVSIICFSL